MAQPIKQAVDLCKTIMRNGFDAYVINAGLQQTLFAEDRPSEVDIATDMPLEELSRLFPNCGASQEGGVTGMLVQDDTTFRFYAGGDEEAGHPETAVLKITPSIIRRMDGQGLTTNLTCAYTPSNGGSYAGFEDFSAGELKFSGLPDETLRHNYLLGIRALRFAANYQLKIEHNSWLAIVRGARRILDYVSVTDLMDEFSKVEAENLWLFFKLLFDSMILHGLIPEVAALSRITQAKTDAGQTEDVFAHTLEVMRRYPEELPYDWFGTLACLFHDVGKLYTAEHFEGKWNFYQHHKIGAKVTRKILKRLRMDPEDIDLICHLVRQHMRFHFMLTDRGIRRFKALDEYPRLIEIARADIKARGGNYTYFNHNMKYLERADVPEDMLEPLLNGREIMEHTGLKPGPAVGLIRDELLKAQISGEVADTASAIAYVKQYKDREMLS
ncbi:HD domain-containing protein [Desulfocurvibacter africanus]|uniref:Metal dependent phosphohydrolase n=1 Tax=Desulfocurvibacter africanus subsp. africanus str. Walvis Bay TaxID=690850 RepID=F3YXZ3_DESAF|nr:HD domain-containing protein [Desulfocurvibacter africanus]EGJ50695.1 metal dependent phosphohydrolase [Desulfocurvibacter africanus subsp. africanus str. Walvis Bay]